MRKNAVIELDVTKNVENGVKFYTKQFDDIKIKAKVFEGVKEVDLEGQEIIICIVKEDKTVIEQRKDIKIVDNTLVVDLSKQATTALGRCHMEILIRDEEGCSSTSTISYVVGEKLSATIVDIIQSMDDIDALNMIEEFIQNSNIDIMEIKDAIQDLREYLDGVQGSIEADYEAMIEKMKELEAEALESLRTNAEAVKDDALNELNELVDGVVAETIEKVDDAIEKATDALEKATDAIDRAEETLETITTTKEDVEKIKAELDEVIGNIDESKDEVLNDIANAVVAVEDTKEQAIGAIEDAKTDAIDVIGAEKATAMEEIAETKDVIVDTINETGVNALNSIAEAKMDALEAIDTAKTGAVDAVDTAKTDAIDAVELAKGTILEDIDTAGADILDTIGTEKARAIEDIGGAKDGALEAMSQEEAKIMKRIEDIELSGVTGVDEAVRTAQVRLQELTVSSMWDVRECSNEEQAKVQSVAGEEKGLIREVADIQKTSIEQAGAEIVEMVENLDANIEAGLADIETSRAEGVRDISEMANTQVSRIQSEGQEIIDAVANLEAITDEYVTSINEAGIRNRESLESKALSETREITRVAGEQKESIVEVGDAKLSEIQDILGVTKSDVETLLEETRTELNTKRTELSTMISDGKSQVEGMKNASITEMTETKDALVEELLGAEVELEKDFKELRDTYVADINNAGNNKMESLQATVDRVNALQDRVNTSIDIADVRIENLTNTMTNVQNKMEEVKPILESLDEVVSICNGLQRENILAEENIEELQFLYNEADIRVVTLRELIEEAKRYETVVRNYIESKGGNHDEIDAKLIELEVAINTINERLSVIDTLATKEELATAIEPLSTKEETDMKIAQALEGVGKEISGKIENVTITKWDIPADLSIFNSLVVPENYESVYCGNLANYTTVAFFNRKVECDTTVSYVSEGRYLKIRDFSNSDVISAVYYSSGRWNTISSSSLNSYFNGGTNRIMQNYYHDFDIYDQHGAIWREGFGKTVEDGVINDFNMATVLSRYSVNQKDGELLANSPIIGAYSGVLEVENTGATIKQELSTNTGVVYKRFNNLGVWGAWTRGVDNEVIGTMMSTNNQAFGSAMEFLPMPESIAPKQPYDKLKVYPKAKHRFKYYDGSYYYSVYFFCDLNDISDEKYAVYTDVVSGEQGYNRITFKNLVQHQDYVVYRTNSTTTVPDTYYNTALPYINLTDVKFRVYDFDFNMYNEDGSKIEIPAPVREGLNDFNKATNNGYYPVEMDAVNFGSLINAPAVELTGRVSGVLEVINGKQILNITSHNKVFAREIGKKWRNVIEDAVSKDMVSKIKVSSGQVPPTILKNLPLDERYFRRQDKKTVIFRKNEHEYVVMRTIKATHKPYITKSSSAVSFYINNTAQFCQTDTYNMETGQWTRYMSASTSGAGSISCDPKYFYVYHSDSDIYLGSAVTQLEIEARTINFDGENTIEDYNDAVEFGVYGIEVNADDVIANAPVEGAIKGMMNVSKAGDYTKQEVTTDACEEYVRIHNGQQWTEWKSR